MAPCVNAGSQEGVEAFSKIFRVDIRIALAVPSGSRCRDLAAAGRGGMLVRHGVRPPRLRVVVDPRPPVITETLL